VFRLLTLDFGLEIGDLCFEIGKFVFQWFDGSLCAIEETVLSFGGRVSSRTADLIVGRGVVANPFEFRVDFAQFGTRFDSEGLIAEIIDEKFEVGSPFGVPDFGLLFNLCNLILKVAEF